MYRKVWQENKILMHMYNTYAQYTYTTQQHQKAFKDRQFLLCNIFINGIW